MGYAAFQPVAGATVAIAATGSSSTTTIPLAPTSGPYQLRIYNSTAVVAFIREGTGTASITTDMPIAAGATEVVTFDSAQSIGVILASGTGTVYVTLGSGY